LHCLRELGATTDSGILVVEDNPKNLAMAVHGLRVCGYQNVFGLFVGRPARDQASNEQFFRDALIAAELESAAVEIYGRTALVNYDELSELPGVLKSVLGGC
jgi:CheY-like chemotaxis protein